MYEKNEAELYCFLQYHSQVIEFNNQEVKLVIAKKKPELSRILSNLIAEYNNAKPNIIINYDNEALANSTYNNLEKEFFEQNLGKIIQESKLKFKILDITPAINNK